MQATSNIINQHPLEPQRLLHRRQLLKCKVEQQQPACGGEVQERQVQSSKGVVQSRVQRRSGVQRVELHRFKGALTCGADGGDQPQGAQQRGEDPQALHHVIAQLKNHLWQQGGGDGERRRQAAVGKRREVQRQELRIAQ